MFFQVWDLPTPPHSPPPPHFDPDHKTACGGAARTGARTEVHPPRVARTHKSFGKTTPHDAERAFFPVAFTLIELPLVR